MTNQPARMLSRRTQLVWAAFFASMTIVLGLLGLGNHSSDDDGLRLTYLVGIDERPDDDPVFRTRAELDRARWTSIVVHHLGAPAGSGVSIGRSHRAAGLDGLGYHFLIGNGNGLDDGVVFAGYRWLDQKPGAHVPGDGAAAWNEHAIGICLVGNGDRHRFSDVQVRQLIRLVQRLQQELSIPAQHVYLCREIAIDQSSPGELFEEGRFRGQLVDLPAPR